MAVLRYAGYAFILAGIAYEGVRDVTTPHVRTNDVLTNSFLNETLKAVSGGVSGAVDGPKSITVAYPELLICSQALGAVLLACCAGILVAPLRRLCAAVLVIYLIGHFWIMHVDVSKPLAQAVDKKQVPIESLFLKLAQLGALLVVAGSRLASVGGNGTHHKKKAVKRDARNAHAASSSDSDTERSPAVSPTSSTSSMSLSRSMPVPTRRMANKKY